VLCSQAREFLEEFAASNTPLLPRERANSPLQKWTPDHQRKLHSSLLALLISLTSALRTVEGLVEEARTNKGAAREAPGDPPLDDALWDAGCVASEKLICLSRILSQHDVMNLYREHIALATPVQHQHHDPCCVAKSAGVAEKASAAKRGLVTIADLLSGMVWMASANQHLKETLHSLNRKGCPLLGRMLEVVECSA